MAGHKLDWDLLESRYKDAGLILFEKRIDRLRNPHNEQVFERLVLESADWVNVVALDEQRRSVMIRQYRFGVGYTTLETPGGMDVGRDIAAIGIQGLPQALAVDELIVQRTGLELHDRLADESLPGLPEKDPAIELALKGLRQGGSIATSLENLVTAAGDAAGQPRVEEAAAAEAQDPEEGVHDDPDGLDQGAVCLAFGYIAFAPERGDDRGQDRPVACEASSKDSKRQKAARSVSMPSSAPPGNPPTA